MRKVWDSLSLEDSFKEIADMTGESLQFVKTTILGMHRLNSESIQVLINGTLAATYIRKHRGNYETLDEATSEIIHSMAKVGCSATDIVNKLLND